MGCGVGDPPNAKNLKKKKKKFLFLWHMILQKIMNSYCENVNKTLLHCTVANPRYQNDTRACTVGDV